MTDHLAIHHSDVILFSLYDGRRPLECADSIARVSYDTGVNVIHMGTVEGIGYYGGPDGTPALALDDGTIVAIEDINVETVSVNPTASLHQG